MGRSVECLETSTNQDDKLKVVFEASVPLVFKATILFLLSNTTTSNYNCRKNVKIGKIRFEYEFRSSCG